jgi:hypothetical protein
MANAFSSMLRKVIFQKLCAIGGDIIQFIIHNHEGDVTIIPFPWGFNKLIIWGATLFVLIHFKVLGSIANHCPSCLFPSIANNIHIIGPPSIVSSTYEYFQLELCLIVLSIQLQKFVA